MFCKNCGTRIENNIHFCPSCGIEIQLNNQFTQTAPTPDDDIVDLTNQKDGALPKEGKYKPILFTGILFSLALAMYALSGMFVFNVVMARSNNVLIAGLAIPSIIFAILSLPFLFVCKKKAKKSSRKLERKNAIALYIIIWLFQSLSLVCGFADAFSKMGLIGIVTKILFFVFAIITIIVCNGMSLGNGEETLYSMSKGITIGFIVAIPLGYGLGMLFQAMEMAFVLFIIAFIAFFIFGGRVFFIRKY